MDVFTDQLRIEQGANHSYQRQSRNAKRQTMCAGRGEQVGTKSISSCPQVCPRLLRSPAHSPARGSHSDELVLQLWLGDDVHLDGVKQLPGDEVLRDLWKGVTRSPLEDLVQRLGRAHRVTFKT